MKQLLFFMGVLFLLPVHGAELKLKNQIINPAEEMKVIGFDQGDKIKFFPIGQNQDYIIQFTDIVKAQWKEALQKAQIEFFNYIPDNAFIVKIKNKKSWDALNNSGFVSAVIPYSAKLKIDHELTPPSVFNNNQLNKYSLVAVSEAALKKIKELLIAQGVELAGVITGRNIIIVANAQKAFEIAELDGVEWIEAYADIEYQNNNPFDGWINIFRSSTNAQLTGYETGTKLMNFESAYKLGYTGAGVVVAVTDTGLDSGDIENIHPDFKGQVVKGYIKGLFSKSWGDPQGHGTHVAGSIVGTGAASNGFIRGGAYGAKLVMQSNWTPMVNNALAAPTFEDLFGIPFKNDKAVIHSNSWGQPINGTRYTSLTASLDEMLWKNQELLVLFAAGNNGADLNDDGVIDNGSLMTPSGAKNILTVGASKNFVSSGGIQEFVGKLRGADKKWKVGPIVNTTLSDNPNGMAPFSSTGPMQDGRIKPDIVAPGTNILSTRSHHPKATKLWGEFNQDYLWAGGTSMSTPLTAGAAAVVTEYLKSKTNKPLSAALVKAAIIHNATDLFPGQFGMGGPYQEFKTKRPNSFEGFGRVNVGATMSTPYYFMDDRVGLKTGEQKEVKLGLDNIKAGTKMRATLVYTDAPAAAASLTALVNDIDISFRAPNGVVYYPNHAISPDRVNNVEMIEFEAPLSGAYTIIVKGHNVPQGTADKNTQPYALLWNYQ